MLPVLGICLGLILVAVGVILTTKASAPDGRTAWLSPIGLLTVILGVITVIRIYKEIT